MLKWFPEDDPSRLASEFMSREFGGVGGVEVWVDTRRENGLHDPVLLARLDEAVQFAHTVREGEGDEVVNVAKAISVLDVVKETHKALNENRSEFYVIPNDRKLVAQELLLFENSGSDDLESLVDSQFRMARVTLFTPLVDGMLYMPFIERVQEGFERILGDGVGVRVTGLGSLFARSFSFVNVTMMRSYGIALLVITPLMVLLIGNLRRGLLSMVPNLVPIWLALGAMGFFGVPIDNSSLLIGCILIGLAVDDTIHFMHRFQRHLAQTGDTLEAVSRTLSTTGSALLFTTLVLTAGFFVMSTSHMSNIAVFGLISAFAALVAFIADIVLSPALMALATRDAAQRERGEA
jgi:predicted RND superfamily exporter protein